MIWTAKRKSIAGHSAKPTLKESVIARLDRAIQRKKLDSRLRENDGFYRNYRLPVLYRFLYEATIIISYRFLFEATGQREQKT